MPPIYHFTHVSNLGRIASHGGLWSDSERLRNGCVCVNIAYQDLKGKRARKRIPPSGGGVGVIADYVPFHFANRSPMLGTIHPGNVPGYTDGQKSVVYLVTSVERVARAGLAWCFTDGHAIEAVTEFFTVLTDLNKVDWSMIQSWSWGRVNAVDGDTDRMRRKQAEFLVHGSFLWELVEELGVISKAMEEQVTGILDASGVTHRPRPEQVVLLSHPS